MPMPMPIQIVRLAEKYHVKRVYQMMQDQYKEMGMTSLVFVCYTRPDGKLAIDAYVKYTLGCRLPHADLSLADLTTLPNS